MLDHATSAEMEEFAALSNLLTMLNGARKAVATESGMKKSLEINFNTVTKITIL